MNVQPFLAFTPFLSLLYVAFALIQALRRKQQGFGAAFLAFIALAVPLVALILNKDAATRTSLMDYLTLNAIIVFVAGIVTLMIERGNTERQAYHSYGMLGIGFGVLIAIEILAYPIAFASDNVTEQNGAQSTGAGVDSSALVAVLTAQTGLTADEITTQVQSGAKIADLVAQQNGNSQAVITAVAHTLDTMQAQGGRATQFLARLGGNSTDIATQFVQGTLAAQGQRFLTAMLLGGGTGVGQFGQSAQANANGTPASSQAGSDATGSGASAVGFDSGTPGASFGAGSGSGGRRNRQAPSAPTTEPTADPPSPTPTVIRPTVIFFPSPTPTPAATQPGADAQVQTETCTVTPLYDLNLRDKPNTTDSKVYLSIPYGTAVTADGRTSDDWYSVTYDGQAGWVSGEYLTTDGTCDNIPTVTAS